MRGRWQPTCVAPPGTVCAPFPATQPAVPSQSTAKLRLRAPLVLKLTPWCCRGSPGPIGPQDPCSLLCPWCPWCPCSAWGPRSRFSIGCVSPPFACGQERSALHAQAARGSSFLSLWSSGTGMPVVTSSRTHPTGLTLIPAGGLPSPPPPGRPSVRRACCALLRPAHPLGTGHGGLVPAGRAHCSPLHEPSASRGRGGGTFRTPAGSWASPRLWAREVHLFSGMSRPSS